MSCRLGDRRKILIKRPLRYEDAIAQAKKHFPVEVASAPNENIRLLVHIPDKGLVIVDDVVWQEIYQWVEEIVVEVNEIVADSDRDEASFMDEQVTGPAEITYDKHKRGCSPRVVIPDQAAPIKRKRLPRVADTTEETPIERECERPSPVVIPTEAVLGKRKRGWPLRVQSSPPESASSAPSRVPSPSLPASSSRYVSPTLYTSEAQDSPSSVALEMHEQCVREWLKLNPEEPWIILPKHLHRDILAYFSRPRHRRDDQLLPTDPQQRLWIKMRSVHTPRPISIANERKFILNEGPALHAAICRAHGYGQHKDSLHTLKLMQRLYFLPPSRRFVDYWCEHCPGCQSKSGGGS